MLWSHAVPGPGGRAIKANAARMTLQPGSQWSLQSGRGTDPGLQAVANAVQMAARIAQHLMNNCACKCVTGIK